MRRTLVAVALTSTLLTSAPNPAGLLDQIWSFFASFWSAPADSKAGCGWDPSGGQCSPDPMPQANAGCGWDPNGLCNQDPQP